MKKILYYLILLITFFAIPYFIFGVEAASLSFDQSTVSAANGGTFQISVVVDPGSESMNSTDVYVTYDATLIKATAVSAGTLFPTVTNDISTTGKIYIAGLVNDPASSVSTSGTVATITFQGLKEGTGTLSFDCNSSKIIKDDINATNILNCSSNGTSTVTIGSGGTVPTATPGAGSTVPTELPQSGVFDNVVKLAIPGMILLILGGVLRLVL